MSQPIAPSPHLWWEDAAAVLTASLIMSLAVTLLSKAQLLTGGTSGLALLLVYATGTDFGLSFFALNLPFYLLSLRSLGWKPTARTFVAVALVSLLSRLTPSWVSVGQVAPIYAAIAGGALLGVGMLILFRHRTSLGGVNLLALYAQEKRGLRAGYVQLTLDALILLSALTILDKERVLVSLVAAVVLNLVLATNHRPGRYTGVS